MFFTMTDWHTFYACVQDPLSWNRFHCVETPYDEISIAHVLRDGRIVNTKLVAVPIVVPKLLHRHYIQMKLIPHVTHEHCR
jgi:hypothetical protein